MPKSHGAVLWVVYMTDPLGKTPGINVVCEQSEWDRMELAQPGRHILVRSRIRSEAEAEKLARGTSGDPIRRRA
jgi:hypothetical protein